MKADAFRLRVAAIFGLLAVALGAFGAHALKTTWETALPALEAAHRIEVWKTASSYHLIHAVVLLLLAYTSASRCAWVCFVTGITIFSGSLYALCITGITWLGAITPIGGVFLMVGWLLLAIRAGRRAD